MAHALKGLARIVALLVLMAAAVGASRGPATVDAAQFEEPALALLGDGSCGFEDDEETLVVCGREVFAELIDTSWLVMPEGQCSDLLDKLFAKQLCAFDDPDCQRASPGAPAPVQPKLQNSSSSSPTLVGSRGADVPTSRRAWPPAVDDHLPDSLSRSPLERPPRTAQV